MTVDAHHATGNCFQVAGDYIIHTPRPDDRLVHAIITGRGPIEGMKICHAWIERDDEIEVSREVLGEFSTGAATITMAIDRSNGNNVALPAEVYRRFARIEVIREYTRIEALRWMLHTEHFGPWDAAFGRCR